MHHRTMAPPDGAVADSCPAGPFTGVRCELRHTLQFALVVVRIVVPVLILWGIDMGEVRARLVRQVLAR